MGLGFIDYDRDGDQYLFVAGRVFPGEYGYTPVSYLFTNNPAVSYTHLKLPTRSSE